MLKANVQKSVLSFVLISSSVLGGFLTNQQPSEAKFRLPKVPPAAREVGKDLGTGLGTNWLYDQFKGGQNQSSSAQPPSNYYPNYRDSAKGYSTLSPYNGNYRRR